MKTRRTLNLWLTCLLLAVTLMTTLAPEVLGAPLPPPTTLPSPALSTEAPHPELVAPTRFDPAYGVGVRNSSGHAPAATGKEWDSLPPEIQAKVDPRILTELHVSAQVGAPTQVGARGAPSHLDIRSNLPEPPKEGIQAPNRTRFIVYLEAQADLRAIERRPFATTVQRRTAVVNELIATAQATQGPVHALLHGRQASGSVAGYFPYYVFNGFAVEGDLDTVIELALRDDVNRIAGNYPLVKYDRASLVSPAGSGRQGSYELGGLDPENWNIDLVDAERVWNDLGVTGSGAIVADFDTGVDWDHPALQDRYRGWDGTNADHNYNWFEFNSSDPAYWDTSGNYGPSASTEPYDCQGHGTHTLGTMVGDGGTPTTRIGMAPGARWIAVPGICGYTMPSGYADDIGGIRTFQWLLCPTDLSGDLSTRDCSLAPDVINNSWGSSNPADDTFRPIVQVLRAAGIAPVFASGNPSSGLGSIGSPGSIPEGITVGATDSADSVTPFSGRGPSLYEGVQKPELTAPGANIKSSVPDGGYVSAGGTSMAAPHVSGLIALMVSADLQDGRRDLNVDELLTFMEYSALDLGPSGPDDEYGYGRIDAYNAVRWILGAGDLRGQVRDADSGEPIAEVRMTGTGAGRGDRSTRFTTQTDAAGVYSTTVPGGTYDVHIQAFGYASETFGGVSVLTGTSTLVDFHLAPLPVAALTGRVTSDAGPVRDARVYVDAKPDRAAITGPDGSYTLQLPVDSGRSGTHDITVKAAGAGLAGVRIAHASVTVSSGGSTYDWTLAPAPTLLLVEADGFRGWFMGRPARNFFQWSLDDRDYLYDTYVITDTSNLPILTPYDVVIWAHTAGSPGASGSATSNLLQSYLDGGGRLILSGQDIGYLDDWQGYNQPFYRNYLHASLQQNIAAGLGGTVSGSGFLDGINLTLNEAAQYNYDNTATAFSPDGVLPYDGNAYPILMYDRGTDSGDTSAAALAIDPCSGQNHRAVYLSVGYENLGPRAYDRPPEHAELLERSIQWVIGSKQVYDVSVSISPAQQIGEPGSTVRYDLVVANSGATAGIYNLALSDNAWQTRILSGTNQVDRTIEIPPCGNQVLTVEVDIPTLADAGEQDTTNVVVTLQADPAVSGRVSATTVAFPPWKIETPMPTPRYRLAAASQPGDTTYYAIGGIGGPYWTESLDNNERYNACTGQWEILAPMPAPRGNLAAAAIDNKIYTIGGFAAEAPLDDLEIYDPATDSWSSGAPLPESLSGAAAAAYNGKLYVFGGDNGSTLSDKTYEYDPATDVWLEKAPLPGGGRAYAAAAELDGKIYVVGGWLANKAEVYDPAIDSWTSAAPMNYARQAPGATTAPDGYLYVSGGGDGWTGLSSAERYDPATNIWQLLPSLSDSDRAGSASAYAAGRIFAVGGVDTGLNDVNESLRLFDSFCRSSKRTWQNPVQPFESPIQAPALLSTSPLADPSAQEQDIGTSMRITYTIELHSDVIALESASVIDPIPERTTFAEFGDNPVGATYDDVKNQVEWSGTIPRNSPPLSFTFGTDIDLTEWASGDLVVNKATFDSGTGQVFTRTATTKLDFADPTPSAKMVDPKWAKAGDTLTYTVRIESSSSASGTFTMVDPIPTMVSYVTDSLTTTAGAVAYDPINETIHWTGTLPTPGTYVNESDDYQWGDSDGVGDVPSVTFEWVDIRQTGVNVGAADDWYYCDLPIGFTFEFYDNPESTFCVSTNGFVSFDPLGHSDLTNDCPLPSPYGNEAIIAALWDDLVVEGGIYYQTLGVSPDRYLVVQWDGVRHYGDSTLFDFEVILYENGAFKVQILNAGPERGSGSTTGIQDYSETRGLTYACDTEDSIHDGLAVVFVPGGGSWLSMISSADVVFAATTDTSLPVNTWVTNTATITGPFHTVQRSAGTRVNSLNLSNSRKEATPHATTGERIAYDLVLENTGLLPTNGATLTDPIPDHTAYVPDSLRCDSGTCSYTPGTDEINWSGTIESNSLVSLTFDVTLVDLLPDMTPITNTATLRDGHGGTYSLQASSWARAPSLAESFKEATPSTVYHGDVLTYTIYVRNSSIVDASAEMRDLIPSDFAYVPASLTCGVGSCDHTNGVITWSGAAPAQSMVPIQFQVTAPDSGYRQIVNTAVITNRTTAVTHTVSATVQLSSPPSEWPVYLPITIKNGR
jgi:uncharacterized repeat protein (TIGR01451 family)